MVYFKDIKNAKNIYLYAGDMDLQRLVKPFIGLSLCQSNEYHINHDVTLPTNFNINNVNLLHCYDNNNNIIIKNIDYTNGYISRTPDFDKRVQNPKRPMSIVVDCYKY